MTGRRTALLAAVVLALVIGGILTTTTTDSTPRVVTGPRYDSVSRESVAWYCPEGTGSPDGRADEEILIGNVDTRESHATVTVMSGSDAEPARHEYDVPAGKVVHARVAEIAPVAEPGVIVEVRGGRSVVEHRIRARRDDALGPCAREPSTSTRFAAGTTRRGAQLWLALFNPFPDDAIVDVSAFTGSGVRAPGKLQGIVVPRFTRVSVPLHDAIPRVDLVATNVVARRGRVVTEETLTLDGSDGRTGIALSLGGDPSRVWRFPSAVIGSGHDERLVVANPADRDVRVRVSFSLDAAAALEPQSLLLPGQSVTAVDLSLVPPDVGFSMVVEAQRPVVAELLGSSAAPQPANARGIATDLGMTRPAREWAIVPARISSASNDRVAVVAPDGRMHRVRLLRTDRGAAEVVGRATVPAKGRALVDLDTLVDDASVTLVLRSDGPVVVERDSSVPGVTRSHAVPR